MALNNMTVPHNRAYSIVSTQLVLQKQLTQPDDAKSSKTGLTQSSRRVEPIVDQLQHKD